MNNGESLIRVENLKVSFFTAAGEVQAVRGVSWELKKGETIAIVGESGCGKSVSIQTVMGLLQKPPGRVMGGEIYFKGDEISHYTEKEMRKFQGNEMSMIFQDPLSFLNPTMRVGDQVAEVYMEHHKVSKKEALQKAVEMFKSVSLPDPEQCIKRYPYELSGGMRQRVMVAMALIGSPSVLFADEPTTALDVTIQAQIIDLMNEMKEKTDTSIVLITHDLGVVAQMASRVYVMYAGQIVEHGDIDTIFNSPKHPYTRALLSAAPRLDAASKMKLANIPGSPPDLLVPPAGCAFAARCKYAMNICTRLQPEYRDFAEPCHYAACWLNHEKAKGGRHE